MRTIAISLSLFAALLVSMSAMAGEKDSARVEKKIIKTVIIDDDKKVMIDSTMVTENGKVTVHVDTLNFPHHAFGDKPGHRRGMAHQRMMQSVDGMDEQFDMTVEVEGDSAQTVMFGEPGCKHKVMKFGGEPGSDRLMMFGNMDDMPFPPAPPVPPVPDRASDRQAAPNRCLSGHQGMIDLNDPSVISYEKKIQKDGTEKITIIRNVQ
ncbi:MAG TPA: hypothetical protein PKH79_04885 [Prolixibacteraceae bacterium]|nr:hypothetical protein [Prolixibacteraceae bacterium]HPS13451.1 hypothetical protein [Prolixibacteraceae bacterium]